MIKLAEACERIAGTTKKLEKTAIVAEYLKARTPEEASVAAIFLSGRPFPVWEETTLQVGGRVLWRIVAELSGKSEAELTAAYRKHGDLGAVAEAVLAASATRPRGDGRPRPSWPGKARQCIVDRARSRCQIPRNRGRPRPGSQGRTDARTSCAGHASRSQVHCEDHDWRSAHRPERKPGGRSHRQGLRRNVARGAAGQHAAGRHWRDSEAGGGRAAWPRRRCACSIPWASCWPARRSRPKRRSAISKMLWSKTSTTASAPRPTVPAAKCESSRAPATRSPNRFPNLPDALAGLPDDAILDGEIVAWSYENVAPASRGCPAGFPPARETM